MKSIVASLCICLFIFSCTQQDSILPNEYMRYVADPENGFIRSKDMGPVTFEVQYRPLEYMCLVQNSSPVITDAQLESLKAQFTGLTYFKFSVKSIQNTDPLMADMPDSLQLEDRIRYLTAEAVKDFWLIRQKDTVKCVLHHFERNYGLAPRVDITLAFEDFNSPSNLIQPVKFCFRDKIFNSGTYHFDFDSTFFATIPTVKTNNL